LVATMPKMVRKLLQNTMSQPTEKLNMLELQDSLEKLSSKMKERS
jgi:hypothetical protein